MTAKQLKVRFGSPVGAPILGATTLFCTYTIGKDPTVVPGGTFTAIQQYPNLFAPRLDDARVAVEDQLAIDQLSDQDIEDVPKLGNSAYLNRTKGEVVFSATRKLAFILNWSPAPAGTPLTPRQERHLITLAQEVIKRVKG